MMASMMRAATLAVLVATTAAPGAVAQQPAPPASATAQIAPSHLAAARDMALVLKLDEPLRAVLDELQSQTISTFSMTRPELANDLKQVLAGMNAEIVAKREEMFNNGARALAARFTEPEIIELTKFMKTPLGEKYIRLQPQAFSEYLSQLQPWIAGLNEFVITRVRAEMKKKGHDL